MDGLLWGPRVAPHFSALSFFFPREYTALCLSKSDFSEFDNIMFGNKLIYKNMTQSDPDLEFTGAEN